MSIHIAVKEKYWEYQEINEPQANCSKSIRQWLLIYLVSTVALSSCFIGHGSDTMFHIRTYFPVDTMFIKQSCILLIISSVICFYHETCCDQHLFTQWALTEHLHCTNQAVRGPGNITVTKTSIVSVITYIITLS